MTEITKTKIHEEQIVNLTGKTEVETATPLTRTNAYRVTSIRRKDTKNEAIPFFFRAKHTGMHSYIHTYGEDEKELHPSDFKEWEAVTFKYPGHLEEYQEKAYDAYQWSSFDPDGRGETEIMQYEKQLQENLLQIPEEKQEEYIAIYKQKFSSLLGSLSNCASTMITGSANFNHKRNEKANRSYDNRYNDFQNWRNRFISAMQRIKEAARPEEEKQEEVWSRLKRDIASSARTIHEIDTGKARGYDRVLFVSNILNKVSAFANHGEVEIVQRAVDFITEYNFSVKKPIITARNKFFQLPEIAQRMKEKLQTVKEQESKEVKFEGGTLVWNYEEDRLQILFDDIPEESKRKKLKSSGFRWSPRNKAWQRQLTSNAIYAAKEVLNLTNN